MASPVTMVPSSGFAPPPPSGPSALPSLTQASGFLTWRNSWVWLPGVRENVRVPQQLGTARRPTSFLGTPLLPKGRPLLLVFGWCSHLMPPFSLLVLSNSTPTMLPGQRSESQEQPWSPEVRGSPAQWQWQCLIRTERKEARAKSSFLHLPCSQGLFNSPAVHDESTPSLVQEAKSFG